MSERLDIVRWGVIGQDAAVGQLASAVQNQRIAHAYLFTGPEGVGRTTLALAFARALNCEAPLPERPCGVCDSCRRISHDGDHHSHTDVTLADLDWQATVVGGRSGRRTANQQFSIDSIRWLRQDIATRPVSGRWKIQIIDDADQLSDVAPDAFLKTLEEPPPYAVIILIASSVDAVSETIRSRVRHVPLSLVRPDLIEQTLLDRGVDQRDASSLALASRGRIAWALKHAADEKALERRRELISEAFEQLTDPLARLTISGPIATNHTRRRDQTFELLDTYLGMWRDTLFLRSGLPERVIYPEVVDQLEEYAKRFEVAEIYRAIWATQRCMNDLNANFQARIALHAMVMQWPE